MAQYFNDFTSYPLNTKLDGGAYDWVQLAGDTDWTFQAETHASGAAGRALHVYRTGTPRPASEWQWSAVSSADNGEIFLEYLATSDTASLDAGRKAIAGSLAAANTGPAGYVGLDRVVSTTNATNAIRLANSTTNLVSGTAYTFELSRLRRTLMQWSTSGSTVTIKYRSWWANEAEPTTWTSTTSTAFAGLGGAGIHRDDAGASHTYIMALGVGTAGSSAPRSTPVAAPTITTQPSAQTVTAGATATFSVVASGTGLTYQWYRNGSSISGAIAASYTTPATTVTGGSANSGDTFYCAVTNGGGTVNSSTVALTVNAAPATAITLSAATTAGQVGVASGAITVGANGAISGSHVVTLTASGPGGTLSATTVTLTAASPSATVTFTPSAAGATTISAADAGGYTSPTPVTYTASITTYSMTLGPFALNTGSGPILNTAVSYTLWAGVDTGAVSGTAINGSGTTHATTGVLTIAGLPSAGVYLCILKSAAGARWHNVATAA